MKQNTFKEFHESIYFEAQNPWSAASVSFFFLPEQVFKSLK